MRLDEKCVGNIEPKLCEFMKKQLVSTSLICCILLEDLVKLYSDKQK